MSSHITIHHSNGELIITCGTTIRVNMPAPCMGSFSMDSMLRAFEEHSIYQTNTSAQVSAYISEKNGVIRYAWSFGPHTPCGSAISIPSSIFIPALHELVVKDNHHKSNNFMLMDPPPWLQCGIEPDMKHFTAPQLSQPIFPRV